MMNKNFIKIVAVFAFAALSLTVAACRSSSSSTTPASGNAQTPTDAYKMLFAAVKSKNTEEIKKMLSANTQMLAEFQASRSNQPLEKVYANGFTETTFSANLPQIRDERVNENFGAVEVWNEKSRRWEDLPFIKEDGAWKLAVGDIFKGNYESPGKSQSFREQEAANVADPSRQAIQNANVNMTITNKNAPQPPPPSKKDREAEKK
jgi:hypothetical protein